MTKRCRSVIEPLPLTCAERGQDPVGDRDGASLGLGDHLVRAGQEVQDLGPPVGVEAASFDQAAPLEVVDDLDDGGAADAEPAGQLGLRDGSGRSQGDQGPCVPGLDVEVSQRRHQLRVVPPVDPGDEEPDALLQRDRGLGGQSGLRDPQQQAAELLALGLGEPDGERLLEVLGMASPLPGCGSTVRRPGERVGAAVVGIADPLDQPLVDQGGRHLGHGGAADGDAVGQPLLGSRLARRQRQQGGVRVDVDAGRQ